MFRTRLPELRFVLCDPRPANFVSILFSLPRIVYVMRDHLRGCHSYAIRKSWNIIGCKARAGVPSTIWSISECYLCPSVTLMKPERWLTPPRSNLNTYVNLIMGLTTMESAGPRFAPCDLSQWPRSPTRRHRTQYMHLIIKSWYCKIRSMF